MRDPKVFGDRSRAARGTARTGPHLDLHVEAQARAFLAVVRNRHQRNASPRVVASTIEQRAAAVGRTFLGRAKRPS